MNAAAPEHAARAGRIIAKSLVWDNHACMPLRPDDHRFLPQLERVRNAGVDCVSLNAGYGPQGLESHLRMLASFRSWLARHADRYTLIERVADIDRARDEGKLAVHFDVEGMGPLNGGGEGLVRLLHDLGVRWMSVAYNRGNDAGSGCYDEDDPGLSAYGRRIVAEMKDAGMAVCCSHTGHRTAADVLECADNPVIFSHSNPSAVHAHQRNIPDALILGCAATGGVVGINGIGVFLGANDIRPETIAHHVDYVCELAGADHVAIALDYVYDVDELMEFLTTMRSTFPRDTTYAEEPRMAPPESLSAIVTELCRLGYDDADLAKILGGNWRRVAERVWK